MKVSTQNLFALPDIESLQKLSKSLAVLDAIIAHEWESRYYSYDKVWDMHNKEECLHMRDGSGDQFKILFSPKGAVINGYAHESEMCNWKEVDIPPSTFSEKLSGIFGKKKTEFRQTIWKGVVDELPEEFRQFIFGEPVRSIGTTFCIWRKTDDTQWHIGQIDFPQNKYRDGSADLLYILDGNPATYRKWALEYYELEPQSLLIDLIRDIYEHKPLTKEIVLKINPEIDDFEALKKDMDDIGYPCGDF